MLVELDIILTHKVIPNMVICGFVVCIVVISCDLLTLWLSAGDLDFSSEKLLATSFNKNMFENLPLATC